LPHLTIIGSGPADELAQASASVGSESHLLRVAGNDAFELYDWSGGSAKRFDGVDRRGGETRADLQHVFEDNRRTERIRMEEETAPTPPRQGSPPDPQGAQPERLHPSVRL
jgi:hypothetical protein